MIYYSLFIGTIKNYLIPKFIDFNCKCDIFLELYKGGEGSDQNSENFDRGKDLNLL